MSISGLYPNLRPSLLLDFAQVGRLDPRISFSRASSATVYDGVTTAKAEENLLTYSQEFNETAWTKTDVTATADTSTAPDGTSTADTLTASAGTGIFPRCFRATTTGTSGASYVVSIFAKAGTHNYIQLSNTAGTNWHANFDLTAGSGATGTSSGCTSSIVSVGSDWYRCIVVYTPSTTDIAFRIGIADSSSAARFATWNPVGTETVLIWGAQLEQRSAVTAYTATTTQPITNYIPVLLTAAAGVPRFDHVPTTGVSQGLLIEEQRTNSLLQSEDFSTTWSITGTASISTNVTSSPAGTITADKFILGNTITSGNAAFFQLVTKAATATTYTTSVFVKAAEFNSLRLILRDTATAGNNVEAYFNAATGAIAFGPTANGTFTGASATISAVGNGWYRVTLTGTTSTETSVNVRMLVYQNGTSTATGDGFSGIFIWGAMLEQGAFSTSYVPTTTTALTRNADAASMTGTNFSSWFNASQGTVLCAATRPSSGAPFLWTFSNGATASNRYYLRYVSNQYQFISRASGVDGAGAYTSAASALLTARHATAYVSNQNRISSNGTQDGNSTQTVTSQPTSLDTLYLGSFTGTSAFLNGTIQRLAFYPIALPNAQLVALTG